MNYHGASPLCVLSVLNPLWSMVSVTLRLVRLALLLTALSFGYCTALHAADETSAATKPTPSTPEAAVDSMISRLVPPSGTGLAVLIARDGRVIFKRGYGLADVDANVPTTTATKFRIGAITNQFTAAAILKLQEQGKLKVSDKLEQYFPGYPRGSEMTLHHLLTHTSGLHSYTQDPNFKMEVSKPITTPALLELIKNYDPEFTPGLMWSYSNSGYVLLGQIVEKVSGSTYEDFLRTTFFEPLGMTNTGVYRNDAPPPDVAVGYEYKRRSFKPSLDWDMSWTPGAASLYSTVEDLFRWNEGVFSGNLLTLESRQAAFSPVKTEEYEDPKAGNGYGYGWSMAHYRGAPIIFHGGGLDGFSSYLLRLPERNYTVVLLANALPLQPGLNLTQLANKIVDAYFDQELERLPGAPVKSISAEALDAIVGRYDHGAVTLVVGKEGNRIFYQLGQHRPLELFPKSETEFAPKEVDALFIFVKDDKGKVTQVIHEQNGQRQIAPRMEDFTEITVDPGKLELLTGDYDFGNGIIGTISAEGNKLFGQIKGQRRFELGALSETEFFVRTVNARITFVKDENGNVTKLIQRHRDEVKEAPKLGEAKP